MTYKKPEAYHSKGKPVWYHPVIGEHERYAAEVETDPWQLWHGQWVMHLCNVRGYDRVRIHAACVEAVEDREEEEKQPDGVVAGHDQCLCNVCNMELCVRHPSKSCGRLHPFGALGGEL